MLEVSTHIGSLPHVVAALLVLDDLVLFGLTAAEGNSTGLSGPDSLAGAVEVDVHVPVLQSEGREGANCKAISHPGALNAAALQPALLDPVYQVLLVRVVPADISTTQSTLVYIAILTCSGQ